MTDRQMNLPLGEALRDEGMERAEGSADPQWADSFRAAIETLAGQYPQTFTSETALMLAGTPPEGTSPQSIGAIFGGMSRRGLIHMVGVSRAQIPSSHARMLGVWQGWPPWADAEYKAAAKDRHIL